MDDWTLKDEVLGRIQALHRQRTYEIGEAQSHQAWVDRHEAHAHQLSAQIEAWESLAKTHGFITEID